MPFQLSCLGCLQKVQQLSKMEVEDLLRKGAYGALMDEEDEGSKFCEEDIDQILQRRTQTITIQSEGKGSTFAKVLATAQGIAELTFLCKLSSDNTHDFVTRVKHV